MRRMYSMYIHLGGEKMIHCSELIAIFDISIKNLSQLSKQFCDHIQKSQKSETLGEETKSMIITSEKIFYSPISPSTLKKKLTFFNKIET